ncbi:MAG: pyridoxal-phosphate dependent enzyme [Acidimicrobiia bacterium]
MRPERPTADDIADAARRISGIAVRTPTVIAPGLGNLTLKLETVQPTGSFKIRGAASKILSLDESDRSRGVVTASTGNHGRAVAHVAAHLGMPVAVCVSVEVPPGKIAALETLGCELVIDGASQTEALANADQLVNERGMTLVHPFDDPEVIAGQGTVGLELTEQMPGVRTVVVPLSGGGLAAGVAIATKAFDPSIRVIGVSMRRAAVMAASVEAGKPVDMPERQTLADSLQGGIGLDNRHTFDIVADLVDDIVLVEERDIWAGMRYALEHHRLVLEGGAAVGIGAVLAGKILGDPGLAIICTGSNIEARHLAELAEELATDTRKRRPNQPD